MRRRRWERRKGGKDEVVDRGLVLAASQHCSHPPLLGDSNIVLVAGSSSLAVSRSRKSALLGRKRRDVGRGARRASEPRHPLAVLLLPSLSSHSSSFSQIHFRSLRAYRREMHSRRFPRIQRERRFHRERRRRVCKEQPNRAQLPSFSFFLFLPSPSSTRLTGHDREGLRGERRSGCRNEDGDFEGGLSWLGGRKGNDSKEDSSLSSLGEDGGQLRRTSGFLLLLNQLHGSPRANFWMALIRKA